MFHNKGPKTSDNFNLLPLASCPHLPRGRSYSLNFFQSELSNLRIL